MRGLMHTFDICYSEGMTFQEYKTAVGTTVQKQLQQSLQALDPTTTRLIIEFLRDVDQGLLYGLPNKAFKVGR